MAEPHELKQRVQQINNVTGDGTELVSVYIPADKRLKSVTKRIRSEYTQAANIKTDKTRDRVQTALSRIERTLSRYSETPNTGLVVFSGVVDGELQHYAFDDLPREVMESLYSCSDTFKTGPLMNVISPNSRYGLITVTRNNATIGEVVGGRVNTIASLESQVMGKTRAGGQSSERFARERERQKHEFFQEVSKTAERSFLDDTELDGLLIGGTSVTVDDFRNRDYLHHELEEGVIGCYSVEYGDGGSLERLVKKGSDKISDEEMREEREAMDEFYNRLRGDSPATYGEDGVETALQYGAVETLLVSEDKDSTVINEYESRSSQIGADTLVVSTGFEKGEQLKSAFGGIAALLRYDIE